MPNKPDYGDGYMSFIANILMIDTRITDGMKLSSKATVFNASLPLLCTARIDISIPYTKDRNTTGIETAPDICLYEDPGGNTTIKGNQ